MRAMAVMPEDRFQSLNELLAEIEAPPPKKFRYGSLLLIGAGLAAAAAGAFVIVTNQGRAPKPETVATAQPAKSTPALAAGTTQSSGAAGTDGTTPAEPPPPEETASVAAASPEPEPEKPTEAPVQSAADAISATPLPAAPAPSPAPQRVAKATPSESAPSSSAGGGIDARRKQCIAQCERDNGECGSLSRRGKQECMRAVAFGATPGRITTTNPAATSCAYFGQSRCDNAFNREACLARMTMRYKACVDVLGGTVAQRRQDCDDNARQSDQLCLDDLRDCRQSCE
jgi:hypothetical protein